MPKKPHFESETTFLRRHVDHARRHWWSYGIGAIVAGAFIAWATTAICEWGLNEAKTLKAHYRQSDQNTADIAQLKADYANLLDRCRKLHATNDMQQAQIEACQMQLQRLRSR